MARRKKINLFQIFLTVWQLGRQRPLVFLLLIPISGVWYGYELSIARPGMVYMGVPKVQNWKQPKTWTRIFRNDDAFMVGYSDLRGNPLWVSYKIETIRDDAPYYKRPQRFGADWRNLTHITHDDYRHSGYDRGHMAPNYAISRLYGRSAQLDTFLMTNITPQKPNLNQKLWQRLEEVEIDHFTKQFKTIWVFTGPIFDPNIERLKSSCWIERLKSSCRVEIPDAFYKIYFALPDEKMLAFIVPQQVRGKEPLDKFLASVDEVEKRTGFDFFHELEDTQEEQLESSIKPAPWRLKEVARLPARY